MAAFTRNRRPTSAEYAPSGAALGIDYNGDGLDDILFPNFDTWTWMLAPNDGTQLDTANAIDTNIDIGSSIPYLIADYNNDGREDLLYGAGNNWYVHLSTGTTISTSYTTFSSSGAGTFYAYLADTTGDGLLDIVQRDTSGNWLIHAHNGALPDVVTAIENGLGHSTTVTYQTLSQVTGDHYYMGVATPSSPDQEEYNGARSVVTDVGSSDGIGGVHEYGYYYSSAFSDRSGRGWLSFNWRIARDIDIGTEAVSWYRQDFPYAGAPSTTQVRQASNSQVIKESVMTWDKTTNTAPTPDVHFIRVESTTSKEWEVGGASNGAHLRTVVDDPTYSTTYGLVEERTVTVTQPGTSNSWTTVTDYNPTVNTTYWCLGLPGTVSTQVTVQPGSASATRTMAHVFNSNCTLYYTIDQSEGSNAKQLLTVNTYDGYGNLATVTLDSADYSAQDRKISYSYDSYGHFPTIEQEYYTGLQTQTTWDYVNAQPYTVKGADGLTTTLAYDSFGRISSETGPGVDTTYSYAAYPGWYSSVYYVRAVGSDGSDTYEFLDSLNRSVSTQWRLPGGGWGTQITQYNGVGQVLKVTQPFVYGETAYWEEYAYDLIGRVTGITGLKDTGTTTTNYSYLGHTTQVTNPRSYTTTTVRNAMGQIVQVTDAASGSASYTYRPFGELATLTDAESNTTTISYDARGFKSTMSDPSYDGNWRYDYDVYGQLAKQWSPIDAGSYPNYPTVALTYDQAGRAYQRVEDEGTTTWAYYAYNYADGASGNLYSVTAPGGYSELYSWVLSGNNGAGQPGWVRRTIDSTDYYFYMSYDSQGRLDVLTYPSVGGYTFKTDYDFDAYGHLSAVKDGNISHTYYTLNATDALGQEREITLGNGLKEYRSFYARTGRLNTLLTEPSGGGTDVQHLTLTYDEVGNLKTRDDGIIGIGEDFTYDSLDRLTYSIADYQTGVSIGYSAAGRITSKTDVCGSTWTYGAGSAGPNAVTSACGTNYSYDANGRMITRGSGEIDWYSYDLPSQIDNLADSSYSQFWYGPDRARYKQYQSDTGATITYVGQLFEYEDTASTDTARYYVHTGTRAVALVERVSGTNTTQYLHRDHQSSVTKLTNSGGSVTQSLAFDAWGLRRNASDWSPLGNPFSGSHETERGYTGHEHLDNVGLIHMNGRVQDPGLGRFVSADPLIQAPFNTQSHNRFSYVWNNPVSLIDPSGYDAESAQQLQDWIMNGDLDCELNDCRALRDFLRNVECGFYNGGCVFATLGREYADWANFLGVSTDHYDGFLSYGGGGGGSGSGVRSSAVPNGGSNPHPGSDQFMGQVGSADSSTSPAMSLAEGGSRQSTRRGRRDQLANVRQVRRDFMSFVRNQGVYRFGPGDPIVVEIVAGSWEDLPGAVRNWEPPGFLGYGFIVDDMGNHYRNQRLPGGYHLAVDVAGGPVLLHHDFYDPLTGPIANFMHFAVEVSNIQTGTLEQLDAVDRLPNWPNQ